MSIFRDILVGQLGLSEANYELAKEKAQKEKLAVNHAVELLNLIPEEKLLEAFSKQFNASIAPLGTMSIQQNILDLIPKDLAMKLRVIPIDRAGNNIIVAMGNPQAVQIINEIRSKTGYTVKPVLASELRITQALKKFYQGRLDLGKIIGKDNDKASAGNALISRKAEDVRIAVTSDLDTGDGPIIKLVNNVLVECLNTRASDIHIEPYEDFMRIRLRVDGSLHEIARPALGMKDALITRIKIMSNLNIAEKRLPQDGQMSVTMENRPIDFRVSVLPTAFGEKVVLRILDKANLQVDMTKLGFETDDLDRFKESIHRPYGMVLVTGPTGSGKTTTLYSALADLNKDTDCILTAEDPVEFQLPGVNQVQMLPKIGLDFAAALRSFLRQDPDVILVGEIRDLETAEIAIKAALTGHMVLSTLHTNSAADTIVRLLNMKVEPFNLVSALNAVVAQRLVRRNCEHCIGPDPEATPEVLMQIGIPQAFATQIQAKKGRGCDKCMQSGLKGRIAVHEVMILTEEIKESIINGANAMQLRRMGMRAGMRTLRQAALQKLAQGMIPVSEVTQNTAPDEVEPAKRSAA